MIGSTGSEYSTASDLTPANVGRLAIAWQWEHGERPLKEYDTTPFRFENQPLMVGGVLYVTLIATTGPSVVSVAR